MSEVNEAAQIITESIDRDAKVIFGAVIDDKLKKGEIKVTVVATGFNSEVSEGKSLLNDTSSFLKPRESYAPRKDDSVEENIF